MFPWEPVHCDTSRKFTRTRVIPAPSKQPLLHRFESIWSSPTFCNSRHRQGAASRVIEPILPIISRKLMQRYRPIIMVISTLYIFIYILHTLSISKKSVDDDLNSTTRNGHADYAWKYEATFVTRNRRQERGRNAAHVRPLASRKIAHVNRQLFSASISTAAVSCTSRPFNWAVQSPAFKTPA